jgi:hypothetical protein
MIDAGFRNPIYSDAVSARAVRFRNRAVDFTNLA